MSWSDWPKPPRDTGMCMHFSAGNTLPLGRPEDWKFWVDEAVEQGDSWGKLVVAGGNAVPIVRYLKERGMEPIIRFYEGGQFPDSLVSRQPDLGRWVREYVDAGAHYFEVGNEPNLLGEWKEPLNAEGVPVAWQAVNPRQPEVCAEAWVKDVQVVIANGGLPGIVALAPGGHYNDIDWTRMQYAWLKAHGHAGLLKQGVWIAIHNAALNHPLNYPADAVNQKGIPIAACEYGAHEWAGGEEWVNAERVRGKNPGQHLLSVHPPGHPLAGHDSGGSNCWCKFEALHTLFVEAFGFEVPILGTEGGVWVGTRINAEFGPRINDPRYPAVSPQMQADWLVEIAQTMMGGTVRDNFFCSCKWLEANMDMENTHRSFEPDAMYSVRLWDGGRVPAVAALKAMPKHRRLPYNGATPEPVEPPTEDEIRNEAWNHPRAVSGIPYNKEHAFPSYARSKGLGAPLNDTWDWRGLRMQGYVMGVVYAVISDWANVKHLEW